VASNSKGGQSLPWTVAPAEEKEPIIPMLNFSSPVGEQLHKTGHKMCYIPFVLHVQNGAMFLS
jgi:hypothetical protein